MVARNTVSNFLSKCKVNDETGCWEWTGSVNGDGYGQLKWHGESWRAHRLSLKLSGVDIPDGMCVCHRCDNPSCINPDHLFLGTQTDNMRDCAAKGNFDGRVSVVGEAHGRSKLTASEVLEIKHRYESEDLSQKVLGAQYGIGQMQVSRICRGENWSDINDRTDNH